MGKELSPGVTDRRWIPEGGLQKHRDKIHKESKLSDDHLNLPFEFSKPIKAGRQGWFECVECSRELFVSVNTVMCICPYCKKVTKVERI